MNMNGFTIKNVKPYVICNKEITSCDIYHGNVLVAHYENKKDAKPKISYAGDDAKAEVYEAVSEAFGTNADIDLVQKFLFRVFDLYKYEFTMKHLQKSGQAEGIMILSEKGDPWKTMAVVALRSLSGKTVQKAKQMYHYMGFGLASVCSCPDDFVLA